MFQFEYAFCRFTDQYLNGNEIATEADFNIEFNKVINRVLPADNKAEFEILIGKNLIRKKNVQIYPVRVH